MSWLRRYVKLREAAQSDDWVEMLVLYSWRSADEDFRVAGVIDELCEEVASANEETGYFIQELDVVSFEKKLAILFKSLKKLAILFKSTRYKRTTSKCVV
ncbi:hypothetical protein Tco_1577627 [Tanacetum coccineum]